MFRLSWGDHTGGLDAYVPVKLGDHTEGPEAYVPVKLRELTGGLEAYVPVKLGGSHWTAECLCSG
eukprot:4729873-Karenia_brevis.AAC.1